MNMNPEGQVLLQAAERAYQIRMARDQDQIDARKVEEQTAKELTDWKMAQHGLEVGTIIEYDSGDGWGGKGVVRAKVSAWNTQMCGGRRLWQNGHEVQINEVESMDILPQIYVRHALKSGGWSMRSYTIYGDQAIKSIRIL